MCDLCGKRGCCGEYYRDQRVDVALVDLARTWGAEGKDELAHHALDVIGREAEQDAAPTPCPGCGEAERIEDTGTSADPRLTCKRCGMSWHPRGDKTDG